MDKPLSGVTRIPGRVLAWTGLLIGLGISVGANVAFARHELGPRLSASTAPILVVLAAGILERVPLATAKWWQRCLASGGLVFVVVAAFITSYQHQHALLRSYGNPELSASLLPLAVDALILMASVSLAVIAERRRQLEAEAVAPVTVPAVKKPAPQRGDDATPTASAPVRKTAAEKAKQIQKLALKNPALSPAQIAARTDTSEATVRRRLKAIDMTPVTA